MQVLKTKSVISFMIPEKGPLLAAGEWGKGEVQWADASAQPTCGQPQGQGAIGVRQLTRPQPSPWWHGSLYRAAGHGAVLSTHSRTTSRHKYYEGHGQGRDPAVATGQRAGGRVEHQC